MLGGRYRVLESVGKGSFGQVVSALDTTKGEKVAVKVIKNKEAFRRQARTEIKLLKMLNEKDPSDQWCIVRFQEQFPHMGHTCLVFEHLSFNLYELLKRTHFNGVSLNLVRKFARQILKTLAYLSLPDVDVIHCDLKPENILFRVPNRSAIKVIDFGSSCRAKEQMYVYIQSRFYRSPEVILGLPYSHAIDMWSLGCILVEMHTGTPLFSGRDEHDQVRRFVALKGLPPQHMLQKGKKTRDFFAVESPGPRRVAGAGAGDDPDADSDDGSCSEEELLAKDFDGEDSSESAADSESGGAGAGSAGANASASASASGARAGAGAAASAGSTSDGKGDRKSKRRRRRSTSPPPHCIYRLKPRAKTEHREVTVHTNLRDVLGVHTGGPNGRRRADTVGHSEQMYVQFLDLVERMLDYDPATRIKPMQALNHPFLREDDGTPAGSRTAAAVTAASSDGAKSEAASASTATTATAAATAAATATATTATAGAGTGAGAGAGTGTGTGSASTAYASKPAAASASAVAPTTSTSSSAAAAAGANTASSGAASGGVGGGGEGAAFTSSAVVPRAAVDAAAGAAPVPAPAQATVPAPAAPAVAPAAAADAAPAGAPAAAGAAAAMPPFVPPGAQMLPPGAQIVYGPNGVAYYLPPPAAVPDAGGSGRRASMPSASELQRAPGAAAAGAAGAVVAGAHAGTDAPSSTDASATSSVAPATGTHDRRRVQSEYVGAPHGAMPMYVMPSSYPAYPMQPGQAPPAATSADASGAPKTDAAGQPDASAAFAMPAGGSFVINAQGQPVWVPAGYSMGMPMAMPPPSGAGGEPGAVAAMPAGVPLYPMPPAAAAVPAGAAAVAAATVAPAAPAVAAGGAAGDAVASTDKEQQE